MEMHRLHHISLLRYVNETCVASRKLKQKRDKDDAMQCLSNLNLDALR